MSLLSLSFAGCAATSVRRALSTKAANALAAPRVCVARRVALRAAALVRLAVIGAVLFAAPAAAEPEGTLKRSGLELLMIEEPGCAYCARWMREVAPGYKKSSEGTLAPLVIRDRFDAEAKDFGRIVYTPTFILLRDGVERGRILGYPGADFFWSMLGELLRRETKSEIGLGSAPSAPRER